MRAIRIADTLCLTLLVSCTPKFGMDRSAPPTEGKLASVTIGNVANLVDQLTTTIKEGDPSKRKAILDSLVYQLKIRPIKEPCDDSSAGTNFDSSVVSLKTESFENQKVVKGCDYSVVMIIGASDPATPQKIAIPYFKSDATKANLLKAELSNASPSVTINLLATAEGAKLWPNSPVPLPPDDVKSDDGRFGVAFSAIDFVFFTQEAGAANMKIKPSSAPSKDISCYVGVRIKMTQGSETLDSVFYKDGSKIEDSKISFTAQSDKDVYVALQPQSKLTTAEKTIVTRDVYLFCHVDKSAALQAAKACFENTGTPVCPQAIETTDFKTGPRTN